MEYVAAEYRNPFGMVPPCEEFVPGYGDVNADFHVVGDHPGVHGGRTSRIPFADREWSERFFGVLEDVGLLERAVVEGGELAVGPTFLSYLHMCVPDGTPSPEEYAALEPFFDAELRAITAHVLLPVGRRATEHVLDTYTAQGDMTSLGMSDLHGREIRGSGWLVVPAKDPATWSTDDAASFERALTDLLATDYRRVSDLGRFFPDDDPYLVR